MICWSDFRGLWMSPIDIYELLGEAPSPHPNGLHEKLLTGLRTVSANTRPARTSRQL